MLWRAVPTTNNLLSELGEFEEEVKLTRTLKGVDWQNFFEGMDAAFFFIKELGSFETKAPTDSLFLGTIRKTTSDHSPESLQTRGRQILWSTKNFLVD